MDRNMALELVKTHLKNENLVKHCLAVEACMSSFAGRFGEDPEMWGLAGLLHDLDYDYTCDDPGNHTLKTVEMLTPYQLAPEILNAIKAHNEKAPMMTRMDKALYAIDPTTGFITAVALMHPGKKLEYVDLERMHKRFKTSQFARGANRDQIRSCENMGVSLDDFLTGCLGAMQNIAADLGL